jgi:hypothetical protein
MLQTLASVRDPSLLNANPPMSHKRDREGDIPDTRQGAFAEAPEEPRVVAGSQRVSRAVSHVELIAAAQLLHEQSITPQLDIQHHQPSRQPYQPLYDLPLNINRQSQSLDFLNQWSSSTIGGTVQHDPNVSNQMDSWLLPANTGMNTDTSRQATLFTYHQLELRTLTSETQTMAYNTPVSMGTAMNGMQVMDGSPAVQGSTANQAQPWHDSRPANNTASSIFQFQNWTDRPSVPHFDHKHPKTSQHQQLRQVQPGPSAGSPHALPPQQDHHQHQHHHPQQSQSTPTMHRRDRPPPMSPTFMDPLLDPQQQEPVQPQPPPQQSAFNHNTLQMWGNTLTASE